MRSAMKDFEDTAADGGELDLRGVMRALQARRRLIAVVTLCAFAASLLFVMVVKPRYTGVAQVLVENQESYFSRPEKASADQSPALPDAEAITSQVQLVMSRDLGRRAIEAMNLKGNPEFDPQAGGPGLLSRLLTLTGLRRGNDAEAREDKILQAYFDRLYVFAVTKSRVLQVEFTSWDPDLAAKGANQVARLYIDVQSDAKRANARMAAASLATLITDLRSKVAAAETRAEEFRAANGLLVGSNSLNMSGQQLADLNSQLTAARGQQAETLAKSQLIRDMLRAGRISEIPDVANNELVRRLAEQRITLRSQIAMESRTLLPGHPRIKDLHAQLAELESQIRGAGEKVARSLENEAKIAGARVVNLQSALDQTKKSVSGASSEEARARELDREARVLREQLEASTAKYQDALARQAAESTPGDARIISRANAPQQPSFPKRLPIVLFATLSALVLSVGFVLAAELLSGRAYVRPLAGSAPRTEPVFAARPDVMPAAQEPRASKVPVAAEPPRADAARRQRIVAAEAARAGAIETEAVKASSTESAAQGGPERVADAISGLAGRIAGRLSAGQASRILVTSGDSTLDGCRVALALGRALVADRRTILVDFCADPRADFSPRGLADLIAGTVTFEDAIHRDRGSRLHLLPAGRGGLPTSEAYWPVLEALSQT
jgi:uncharacterized protein involved in exopolysaccharide biosynthesis